VRQNSLAGPAPSRNSLALGAMCLRWATLPLLGGSAVCCTESSTCIGRAAAGHGGSRTASHCLQARRQCAVHRTSALSLLAEGARDANPVGNGLRAVPLRLSTRGTPRSAFPTASNPGRSQLAGWRFFCAPAKLAIVRGAGAFERRPAKRCTAVAIEEHFRRCLVRIVFLGVDDKFT
jgi:hypothetical protein